MKRSVLVTFLAAFACFSAWRADVPKEILSQVKALFPIVLTEGIDLNSDEKLAIYRDAQLKLRSMGVTADQAPVELAKDREFVERHSSFRELITWDRDLVAEALPVMRRIAAQFLASSEKMEANSQLYTACNYLVIWGDSSDVAMVQQCLTNTGGGGLGDILKSAKYYQDLRATGKPMPWEDGARRTKFHQFGYTSAEWQTLNAKTVPSAKAQGSAAAPPTPEKSSLPKLAPQQATEPQPERGSWLAWLVVVIVATAGALWVCKSK